MKAYNIYYNNDKININPLKYDELIKMLTTFMKDKKMNVKKLKIIKSTIL